MRSKLLAFGLSTFSSLLACSGHVEEAQQGGGGGAAPQGESRPTEPTAAGSVVMGEGGAPVALGGQPSVGHGPTSGGAPAAVAGMPPAGMPAEGGPSAPSGVHAYAARCAKCHGAEGRGGMYAPEIMHPVREYASWVVRHGRPYSKMPAFEGEALGEAELSAIFDYLDTPPQPTTGAKLFADYCGNCHDDDGRSGPPRQELTQHYAEIVARVRQGANPGQFQDRQRAMPAFSKERLSDAQLQRIIDYLRSP